MIAPADQSLKVVLYEGPGSRPLEASARREAIAALLEAGFMVARTGPSGTYEADGRSAVVLARFEGEAGPAEEGVIYREIAGLDAAAVVRAVREARAELQLPEPAPWVPWFPAIDYDRCTGCLQCENFCLFGVFEVAAGEVVVANPAKCKTNCPACARMCPTTAIIFPKHPGGPIDGAEVDEADVQAKRQSTDLNEELRRDAYDVLRRRGAGAAAGADPAKLAEKLKDRPNVLMSPDVAGAAPAGAKKKYCGDRPYVPCCQNGAVSDDCCKPDGDCCEDGTCCPSEGDGPTDCCGDGAGK